MSESNNGGTKVNAAIHRGRSRRHVILWASWVLACPLPAAEPKMSLAMVPAYGPALEMFERDLVAARTSYETEQRMKFFTAIADGDTRTMTTMLNDGMDPNVALPFPVPKEFSAKFQDELLAYYVSSEPGFTALMMATALNNEAYVEMLLIAGADPWKMTKRHKTFALWLGGKYGHVEIMQRLMGIGPESDVRTWRVDVDIENQKATVWHGGKIELETNISSGRKSHPTPKGRFVVTNKYKKWKSTLYPAQMPYFSRLSCGDFGFHVGNLPGYPASHGCIRLPEKSARMIFEVVPLGTLVEIH